jgi:hypothetical protein
VDLQPDVLKERAKAVMEVVEFAREEAARRVQETDEFAMYDAIVEDIDYSF